MEWRGTDAHTARGYEDTTNHHHHDDDDEQDLDRTPTVRPSSLRLMSGLPSLVCPAATTEWVTHYPFQGISITSGLYRAYGTCRGTTRSPCLLQAKRQV
jgi:hypothetical protein